FQKTTRFPIICSPVEKNLWTKIRHMRTTTRCAILALLVSFLCDCRLETVKQDPNRAVSDANQFLKDLYFDERFPEALEIADPTLRQSTTPTVLREIAEKATQQKGALQELKADSYLMTPGRSMELFYIGKYEKGVLYHRLVLVGDASSGYK